MTAIGYHPNNYLNNYVRHNVNNTIFGYKSDIVNDSSYNLIIGPNNLIDGNNNIIIGNNNEVTGSDNLIIANNIKYTGNNYTLISNIRKHLLFDDKILHNCTIFYTQYMNEIPNDVMRYIIEKLNDVYINKDGLAWYVAQSFRNAMNQTNN